MGESEEGGPISRKSVWSKKHYLFRIFWEKKAVYFLFLDPLSKHVSKNTQFRVFLTSSKKVMFFWKSVPKNPIEQNHQNSSKTVFFMFSKQAVYCDFVNSLYRERVSSIFWRASVGVFLQILWFYWTDKCTSFPKSLVGWTLSIDKS